MASKCITSIILIGSIPQHALFYKCVPCGLQTHKGELVGVAVLIVVGAESLSRLLTLKFLSLSVNLMVYTLNHCTPPNTAQNELKEMSWCSKCEKWYDS